MATREDFMKNLWRWAAGMPEFPIESTRHSVVALELSEWSREFEWGMRVRLIVGAYRYGPIGAPGKPEYDRIEAIQKRCRKYAQTGDQDLLFDIANLALLEFVEGTHPLKHLGGAEHDQDLEARIK